MYRTNTCGELRLNHVGQKVTLAGWVQRSRKMGGMTFVDLRDRYGITQLVFNQETDADLCDKANKLGREYVIQVIGTVTERSSKNANLPTGEIEIIAENLVVLHTAETPPFTIEDESDGGDDIRMQYRYLDLRRSVVRRNLELRHKMAFEVRRYLDELNFLEVETPVLIKSTPEGARDFVVPSRMNPGEFYALPQSPQTLKQLLMVSGFDRYFQIVKCFRDEDLRADRQPEFTQIDCEMSFVEQEDVLNIFEGMIKHLFKKIRGIEFNEPFLRMTWADAMKYYGSDKPDMRFGMKFVEMKDLTEGKPIKVIWLYALPMILGQIAQQFYSFCDSAIVGNCINPDALAAVGATNVISNTLIGFLNSATLGLSIPIARYFGAQDQKNMRKCIGVSAILTFVTSIVLTIVGLLFIYDLLVLLGTPEEIIHMADKYVKYILAGLIFSAIYNFGANLLRAVGDSKTPLIFLGIAVVLNIGLDLLFIQGFHSGVAGAAIATVISQAVAGVACFIQNVTF